MARLTRNDLLGILSLSAGILVFSLQDVIIKALSGSYAVTEAVCIRAVVALPFILCLMRFDGGAGRLVSHRFWPLALRGLSLLVAYTLFYISFPAMPLAMVVALFFIAPIVITPLAAVFLKEKVGLKSVIALALGFAGVLVMTNPASGGGTIGWAVLLPLASALFYAFAMVLARWLGESEPASVMTFYQNATYLLGAGLIAAILWGLGVTGAEHPSLDFLVRPWSVPSLRDFLLLSACGVIAAAAMFLLTQAYRLAEANLVAIFEYTGMIWAPIWGYFIFSETPTLAMVLGTAMIVVAGLCVVMAPGKGEPRPEAASNIPRPRVSMLLRLARRN
jgi:drug/metabolite transporter (DMT)-like permease